MLLFCKVFDRRWLVLVVNTPFSTKALDVCDFIDTERMSLIYRCTMYMFRCVNRLLWRLIFDKSIAADSACELYGGDRYFIPFRLSLCIYRHVEAILLNSSRCIELLGQETDKFGFVCFRNYWETVDDHECVQALL